MSRTLRRVIDIVDCFDARRTSLSLTAISECTGLNLATTSRLLKALEEAEFVRRDSITKRYMLGSRLIVWGARASASHPIRAVAEPIMLHLLHESNETVALYVRVGDRRVCVATYESPQPIRHVLPLGSTLRITEAAGGRAVLANLPDDEALRLIRNDPHLSDIERDEDQAGPSGHPSTRVCLRCPSDAAAPHAWSIASPVFDRAGVVTAVLVVSGPDIRIDDQIAQRHGAPLVPAARELSRGQLQVCQTVNRAAEARGSAVMP